MQRPLYNQLVNYYELIEGRDWASEIKLITSTLRDHDCGFVVDLGCGTGYQVRALTRLGYRATGIDISKQNIRFAKEKAAEENIRPSFVVGSYYEYHPDRSFDAALCLNWSIPVRDAEVKRFLDNTYSLLRPGGLLIFDYERISQIVWGDVGKPIMETWGRDGTLIVRVSVGHVVSNVLHSRDVYLIYPRSSKLTLPNERLRYEAPGKGNSVQTYVDSSYVRFFSLPEVRSFARDCGFEVTANRVLPRGKYKRNYAVLERTNGNG